MIVIDRLHDGFANENERREHAKVGLGLMCWAQAQGKAWATDEMIAERRAYIETLEAGV